MLGGEPLVVGTEGLRGGVDPEAVASLRELCPTLSGKSPFDVEGGEGETSLFLGGCSPPLWLGLDGAGGGKEATTGAPQGDDWDPNDHTFGLLGGLAASPPAPPPNDKPEGGSTRNKNSKDLRRGKGAKKKGFGK